MNVKMKLYYFGNFIIKREKKMHLYRENPLLKLENQLLYKEVSMPIKMQDVSDIFGHANKVSLMACEIILITQKQYAVYNQQCSCM